MMNWAKCRIFDFLKFLVTKCPFLGIVYNEGLNRKGGVIMPTQSVRVKQIFAILFSVLLMFSSCIAANADTNDSISTYYAEINSKDVSLTISGIKATCKASLFAKKPTALKIKIELQKKKSDKYETVETWTKSGNGLKLDLLETRNINRLCKYRIKATFTAGSEKEVVYQY